MLVKIEKGASGRVLSLLQVFEDGQLTDGTRNTWDFRNTHHHPDALNLFRLWRCCRALDPSHHHEWASSSGVG